MIRLTLDDRILSYSRVPPTANAGRDTTVSINDTIRLHGAGADIYDTALTYAWDIGNIGLFKDSRKDTVIIAPATANSAYRCVLRVRDSDGNMAYDTVVINVLQDNPVANAGRDTVVFIGHEIHLHGSGVDTYGRIAKYEWDIGGTGSFLQTSTGDTVVNAPSSPVKPYYCILRVTDDDGNIGLDTVNISVVSVNMVFIPGGTFEMGATYATPIHSVTITDFKMGSTEVTQELYTAVKGTNPSYFDSGATYPVEMVSWYYAALFCNALSKMSGKDTVYSYSVAINSSVVIDYTKNGYRMPTEAEWEYACRAGITTDYYWGKNYPPTTYADTLAIDSNAVWYHNSWVLGSSSPDYGTHKAGSKKPNAFGLYDMSGNVFEWVNDWYGNYTAGAQADPSGPAVGDFRVLRGGGWDNYDDYLRSAYRYHYFYPDDRASNVGFRLACRP
jgi:formylglycine-generating enzyme required for sulfatase activity